MMFNKSVETLVDSAFTAMMVANASDPYDHDTYKRCEAVFEAMCVVYCKGDQELASGLIELIRNNGSTVGYIVNLVPVDEIRQYA